MKTFGRILGGLGFVALTALFGVACMAPADPEPEDITADGDEEASGEENVSEAADAVGTCHGTVTCANPVSCAGWSTYYDCGTSCVPNRGCGGCGSIFQDPECEPDGTKGLRQHYEKFRTCTLQNGTTCTEYSGYAGGVIDCCAP